MKIFKKAITAMLLVTGGSVAHAADVPFTCAHEGRYLSVYVTIQSTGADGVFRAVITEKNKLTHDFPGDPLPVIAEYDHVYHNQHVDFYTTNDGQFSLRLGDGLQPHLHSGDLDLDLNSCSGD